MEDLKTAINIAKGIVAFLVLGAIASGIYDKIILSSVCAFSAGFALNGLLRKIKNIKQTGKAIQ